MKKILFRSYGHYDGLWKTKWTSTRSTNFYENNVSWPPINCNSLNPNYAVFSESLKKDELISTEHLSKTDVSKNSVNSEPFSNSKSSLDDQHNLGSNLCRLRNKNDSPQESFLDKSILTQWEFFYEYRKKLSRYFYDLRS